jgi:hypothetical protein
MLERVLGHLLAHDDEQQSVAPGQVTGAEADRGVARGLERCGLRVGAFACVAGSVTEPTQRAVAVTSICPNEISRR